MIAMVWPAPVPTVAPRRMESIPYAPRICAGVYPTGVAEPAGTSGCKPPFADNDGTYGAPVVESKKM